MIRLLTAVLLFASFNAVAEVTLTDINNDEVADAEEVMGNFNALKDGVEANASAIDALPTPPTDCTINQIIKWNGSAWICADTISAPALRELLTGVGWGFTLQDGPTYFCCMVGGDAGPYDSQLCDPLFDPEYRVCDNDRGPVQRECSPTISTYYCAERIESCDGAGCDAVPSCKNNEATCNFSLSGAGVVTCDLDSVCDVSASSGRVENAVICKTGATCNGRTGTGDSTLYMYCGAGSTCDGSASTGDALTVMVCANESTCTGGPSTGDAIVKQACEAGANCTCTPGISNSQCLTDDYANYTWPQ
jgi:hypothetical protein